MPGAAVTANSPLASLGRYWRDSRPRHCRRADITAWRPQKSHYCINNYFGAAITRWMNYVPRKMPDVWSRYARFTIAPTYVRMLRYMDECYGLFTTKNNHLHFERHKLRQMVMNRDVLSVLLFVTIFHYSLENMSKFPRLYNAQFVREIEDSINTTDTPYKMQRNNWYNFMTYKTCHTMFFLP